jgi:hypothetical protein
MNRSRRRRSWVASVAVAVAFVPISIDASAEAGRTAAAVPVLDAHVVDQTYGVPTDGTLAATFELAGPAAEITSLAAGPASVTITVHDPITSAAELDQPAGERDGGLHSITLPADDVLSFADGRATGRVSIPLGQATPESDGFVLADPAIYPLTIDVDVGDTVVATASTLFEVVGDDGDQPPLSIAILAAVGDSVGPANDRQAAAVSDDVDSLVALADAVDAPLSISLPPSVITGITELEEAEAEATASTVAATGTSSPAVSETENRFAAAFRADELLAQPTVPLDPSALVAVGATDMFTSLLRDGEDIASTASPRAVISRAVWVTDRAISRAGATSLRDLGIRMLVVTDTAAAQLGVDSASTMFEVALGATGTLPALMVSPLGTHLESLPSAAGSPTANERAVRLMAELQLADGVEALPAVLLATPGVGLPDPGVTAQFAAFVDQVPDAAVVPLSRLPGVVDGALTGTSSAPVTLPARAGADLTQRIEQVDAVRVDADHAASMLVDRSAGTTWQARLDGLLSSTLDDATALQEATAIESEIDAVLAAVEAPEPFTVTMTGTSNTLRLAVHNSSDMALHVQLRVRSPKLVIPDAVQSTEIPALSSVEVEIPVEARSNGTFTIEVDVLTPDGYRIGMPVVLKARVSRITGLSQVVTGGAVLVLASWWYSHLRRNHQRRKASLSPAAPFTHQAGIDRPPSPSQ